MIIRKTITKREAPAEVTVKPKGTTVSFNGKCEFKNLGEDGLQYADLPKGIKNKKNMYINRTHVNAVDPLLSFVVSNTKK